VVLGPFHGPDAKVEHLAAGSRRPVAVLRNPPDLAQRMASCELAVCTGGVTALELAALGTPVLLVVVALNQIGSAAALARAGCARHLGWWEQVTPGEVAVAVDELLADPAARHAMAARGPALVDREGARRVVRALCEEAIEFLPVRSEHARLLLDWRNHPDTRRHFFDPREVPWDEHRQWLEAALRDPARVLLLAHAGEPVAAVRLDLAGAGLAVVSIYLDPGRHGQGLGTRILRALPGWCREQRPEVRTLRAEVRPGNVASLRAFEKAGYRRVRADEEPVVVEHEVTA
jgi:RimJ/RimL family protein N-acetyltransferase